MTVHALVERELRLKMSETHREQIPLYPEARMCSAPTAERVFEIFEHLQSHTLLKEGRKIRRFQPQLTELQKEALELPGLSRLMYLEY